MEKNILITGGLGFIGSNFILRILEKKNDVNITNLDAMLSGSNKKNLPHIKIKNYKFLKGNIKNKKIINDLIKKNDIVINFAAESHVDRSINEPKPFIDSNILGVYNILEAIRKYEKKLIQISTDEVFGSLKKETAIENSPFNPSSPYASSKACAELLIKSYHKTYGININITRCTNNYGPRQFPEKLIPKIIILAQQNKKIPIYGNGKNIRDWIYVLDHCDAVIDVMDKGKPGESYNISGNNEISNNIIVKKILKIMGKSQKLIEYVEDRPGHDFRYSLNSDKIKLELGWKLKYDFEKGIRDTVQWYLDNPKLWQNISNKVIIQRPKQSFKKK